VIANRSSKNRVSLVGMELGRDNVNRDGTELSIKPDRINERQRSDDATARFGSGWNL
jgi:hypothetical protein